MSDRPIYNEQAERTAVGILAHASELLDGSALTGAHFFHFATRIVFEAIARIFTNGGKANFHTIRLEISAASLEKIGELAPLIEFAPASAFPLVCAELERCHLLRCVVHAGTRAAIAAQDAPSLADASELLEHTTQEFVAIQTNGGAENVLAATCDAITERLERMRKGESVSGFKTSLDFWNGAFGGIVNGQFYALAGRPGRGKTALMEQLIQDYLTANKAVLLFEKDMSPQKLVERLACRSCNVPYWRFVRNQLRPEEIKLVSGMVDAIKGDALLKLYNPIGLTADKLCAIARREIRQNKVACVFLDHVQALTVGRDMREGLTQASLALRRHVTETNVPLIVLAHLNREAGDGRPSANHIKEFDQLFGDVDSLAMLWFEKGEADKTVKTIKFLIGKNRDGGETEDDVIFDGPMMQFKGKAAKQYDAGI